MTVYTIQQLEALAAAAGQGTGVDTSRNRAGIDTFRPPPAPRDVRRDIYNAVYSAGEVVSRATIAKALSLKKTPWLCQHIERLVDEGYLVKIVGAAPNGIASMFFYSIASQ